jgi:CheY-like chemotaxis protein
MSEFIERHTPKILIVDDSLSDILIMQKSLAGLGDIYNAASGLQALEQLTLIKPEIVLLDVEMPDVSGLEICQAIRDNPDLAATRVIFATVHEDSHTEYLSFKSGADDYLVKPFNMAICRFRVQNQIGLYYLKRQSTSLLAMIDTLPFAVSAWHKSGECLIANQQFLKDFVLTATELPGLSLQTLMGETVANELWQLDKAEDKRFNFTSESGDRPQFQGVVAFSPLGTHDDVLVLTITAVVQLVE